MNPNGRSPFLNPNYTQQSLSGNTMIPHTAVSDVNRLRPDTKMGTRFHSLHQMESQHQYYAGYPIRQPDRSSSSYQSYALQSGYYQNHQIPAHEMIPGGTEYLPRGMRSDPYWQGSLGAQSLLQGPTPSPRMDHSSTSGSDLTRGLSQRYQGTFPKLGSTTEARPALVPTHLSREHEPRASQPPPNPEAPSMALAPGSPITLGPALYTNYFPLVLSSPIYKHSLTVTPISPLTSSVLTVFLRNNKVLLQERFGRHFLYHRGVIYSPKAALPLGEATIEVEAQIYTVTDRFDGLLSAETSLVREAVLNRLFRKLVSRLGLKVVGIERNLFDCQKSKQCGELEIWPGFRTALKVATKETTVLVNIDSITKVIRKTTALQLLSDLKRRVGGIGWEPALRKEMVGLTVITSYSKVLYKVDGVDFGMNPLSTFDVGDGKLITFLDYYKQKYNITIKDKYQPLLINKPRKSKLNAIYLIPELCELVGLSEKQRRDPNFMRAINKDVKPCPVDRMKSTLDLPKQVNLNPISREIMAEWNINFNEVPLRIIPKKIHAGHMIMGEESRYGKLDLESGRNLDKETQLRMLQPLEIQKLIIFFPSDAFEQTKNFQQTTAICLKELGIKVHQTLQIEIRNHKREEEWILAARKYITTDMSFVVYIIHGSKKNGSNYSALKHIMLTEKPVPSQMILTNTLQGKNLKSIVYRIWTQINTKIGGVPWCIDSVPFVESPTMVIGISYSKYSKSKKSFSFLSTVNSTFSRYWSCHVPLGGEISEITAIRELICKAMTQFKEQVSIPPEQIFVFREGNCLGRLGPHSNAMKEVEAMKGGIYDYHKRSQPTVQDLKTKSYEDLIKQTQLVVIAVDKNASSKFYGGEQLSDLHNPQQGTLIDSKITTECDDFFLISQRTNHGTAAPTHYQILHNDLTERLKQDAVQVRNDIAVLSYKLCFLYYNATGSIKTPAPLHYANKLTELVDRHKPRVSLQQSANSQHASSSAVGDDPVTYKLQQMHSLYFI